LHEVLIAERASVLRTGFDGKTGRVKKGVEQ